MARDAPSNSSNSSSEKTQDGMVQDGLAQDGLAHDGLAHDGLAQDGLAQDGFAHDGLAHDGLVEDGEAEDDSPGTSSRIIVEKQAELKRVLQENEELKDTCKRMRLHVQELHSQKAREAKIKRRRSAPF